MRSNLIPSSFFRIFFWLPVVSYTLVHRIENTTPVCGVQPQALQSHPRGDHGQPLIHNSLWGLTVSTNSSACSFPCLHESPSIACTPNKKLLNQEIVLKEKLMIRFKSLYPYTEHHSQLSESLDFK